MEHRIASGSVTKICSQLEARRLIKKVTSVQHKSRKAFPGIQERSEDLFYRLKWIVGALLKLKGGLLNTGSASGGGSFEVWMLYELEPSKEVSGGNWYRDGRLDTDLIERLRQCCLDYITNQNRAVTCEDVHRYVVSQGVSHISHSVEEIGDVLRSLELDRVIMVVPSTAGDSIAKQCYVSRPANLGLDYITRIVDVPCIACPVSAECVVGGRVNPEECLYLSKWLSLSGRTSDTTDKDGAPAAASANDGGGSKDAL